MATEVMCIVHAVNDAKDNVLFVKSDRGQDKKCNTFEFSIVGTLNVTELLEPQQQVTVSCAEGSEGNVPPEGPEHCSCTWRVY